MANSTAIAEAIVAAVADARAGEERRDLASLSTDIAHTRREYNNVLLLYGRMLGCYGAPHEQWRKYRPRRQHDVNNATADVDLELGFGAGGGDESMPGGGGDDEFDDMFGGGGGGGDESMPGGGDESVPGTAGGGQDGLDKSFGADPDDMASI